MVSADPGLYSALRSRKLFSEVGLENTLRQWTTMSDEKLVELADNFVEERAIRTSTKLHEEDPGLYEALRRRGLLYKIEFEDKRRQRKWARMSYEELVSFAKNFIKQKQITNRTGLAEADRGLYSALRDRKLLDMVGLENRNKAHRDWAAMNDKELTDYAMDVVAKRGIGNRGALVKEDGKLYSILWKRQLLDAVFASIELSNEKQAVRDVVEALGEFS